jgi:thiamine biosynthesis lipoprotein
MATRFELELHGDNPSALRAAGEEALDEIERLEAQLSLYRPTSEIAHLNARAAKEPVRVTPAVFALLQQAQELHQETGGAFDITVAPLVRCWGFMGNTGRRPVAAEIAEARSKVGMQHVQLCRQDFSVRFARDGVMLDLGAIGKGYAIERAAELLREAGVTSAFLHGGTSTAYALGHPRDAEAWTLAIENPRANRDASSQGQPQLLAKVPLCDEGLSMSAVWGRCFQAEGRTFGHVIDPRTGQPVQSALLSVVVLPSATETDALSTALLTVGKEGHLAVQKLRPQMRTLLAHESCGSLKIEVSGIHPEPSISSSSFEFHARPTVK